MSEFKEYVFSYKCYSIFRFFVNRTVSNGVVMVGINKKYIKYKKNNIKQKKKNHLKINTSK